MALHILIVDGNPETARNARAQVFGRTPAQSYADVLGSLALDAVCDICTPADAGANLPGASALADYDGIAITGSGLHVYHPSLEVTRQIDLVRAAYAARVPLFGSCWGLQVATVAAGGSVILNPKGREVGVARNIAATEAGRVHPLLKDRASAFDAPCVHYDIVDALPEGATILAQNAYAHVQAAEICHSGGLCWGVQYHPEYSLAHLAAILDQIAPTLIAERFVANADALHAYTEDLRALDADGAKFDIAWRLGLQPEMNDAALRTLELRNWLDLCVAPSKHQRGRG